MSKPAELVNSGIAIKPRKLQSVAMVITAGLTRGTLRINPAAEKAKIVQANIMYTLRVGIAWWIIKMLWDRLNNYYLAVFIGAEMTFAVDYFIFDGMF